MSTRAGWYTDPGNPTILRWWDGHGWTNHVRETAPPPPGELPAPSLAVTQPDASYASDSRREDLLREIAELEAQIVETRDIILLQEVGLYQYAHPLDSSAQYKEALAALSREIAACIKAGEAVTGTTKWAINGSAKEGAKMVSDLGKLMLRAYNIEADNIVRTLKPFSLESAIERLKKMRTSILKLGASMKLEVTERFHALRVRELQLTSDFVVKLEEEKERAREERERLKEEEKARKEFEREKLCLQKEKSHYESALNALRAIGDETAVIAAQEKLLEIDNAIRGVIEREANVRAGYVYVISNIGSFGEEIVKIGMTRRLDPIDRVRELGDASVPFRFDVHAIIFSDDAVGLEWALHQAFASLRVNLVNHRREFFRVSPLVVKETLLRLRGDLLTFNEQPEALEWHQSCHSSVEQAPLPSSVISPGGDIPAPRNPESLNSLNVG